MSSMRDQMRRNGCRIGAPSLRLKKLPHMPTSAIGTTGTGVRWTILSTPGRNRPRRPSVVSAPSGKMHTTSPASSSAAMRSKAACMRCSSSRAGEMGITLASRRNQPSSGIFRKPWYMTKRAGRLHALATIIQSTKLTWLHTSSTAPSSGMFSRWTVRSRYIRLATIQQTKRKRNSGSTL